MQDVRNKAWVVGYLEGWAANVELSGSQDDAYLLLNTYSCTRHLHDSYLEEKASALWERMAEKGKSNLDAVVHYLMVKALASSDDTDMCGKVSQRFALCTFVSPACIFIQLTEYVSNRYLPTFSDLSVVLCWN